MTPYRLRVDALSMFAKRQPCSLIMKNVFTIAFDLGGVVFSCDNDIFCNRYLETELTPGIYDVLMHLSRLDLKLIVISKAFPNNAKKSKEILKLYGLDDVFNSIIFCEKNEAKADIAKAMGVNVMIDDKMEVLDRFDSSIKTIHFHPGRVNELYDLHRHCHPRQDM